MCWLVCDRRIPTRKIGFLDLFLSVVLAQISCTSNHSSVSLEQVDITDEEHAHWFDRYKYDIPVLHMNGQYWIKHRLSPEEATKGLEDGVRGKFKSKAGEPNAAESVGSRTGVLRVNGLPGISTL
jgi:Glutaredoxin-like domain (DUF836)